MRLAQMEEQMHKESRVQKKERKIEKEKFAILKKDGVKLTIVFIILLKKHFSISNIIIT